MTDHGVLEDLVARTFEQQQAFFSLPLQDKMRIAANKYYRHEQLLSSMAVPRQAGPALSLPPAEHPPGWLTPLFVALARAPAGATPPLPRRRWIRSTPSWGTRMRVRAMALIGTPCAGLLQCWGVGAGRCWRAAFPRGCILVSPGLPVKPPAAGLYYGRHVEEDSEEGQLPLHGPNQWPDEASTAGEGPEAAASRGSDRACRVHRGRLARPPVHCLPDRPAPRSCWAPSCRRWCLAIGG